MQYSIKDLELITGLSNKKILRELNNCGIYSTKGKKIILETNQLPESIKSLIPSNIKNEDTPETLVDTITTDTDSNTTEFDYETEIKKLSSLREDELLKVFKKLSKQSVIIMGKKGIGKTEFIKEMSYITDKNLTIFFDEPPTAKTLITKITDITKTNGSIIENQIKELNQYKGKNIYIFIDQLEKMTPTSIAVLDSLLAYKFIKFVGAGHLGGKKKYNNTWLKCHGFFLKSLGREESRLMIERLHNINDTKIISVITNQSKGIPSEIKRLVEDIKAGIPIEEDEKFFDFTPIILIVATLGLAFRVIGSGYSSTETYIIGGVIGSVFWGIFWIYRGYVAGWWGTKKNEYKR